MRIIEEKVIGAQVRAKPGTVADDEPGFAVLGDGRCAEAEPRVDGAGVSFGQRVDSVWGKDPTAVPPSGLIFATLLRGVTHMDELQRPAALSAKQVA
jgi:hypothetical protein